jgi:PKD repeat protein/glucose/arabinose dehydrogenase
MGWIAQRGHAWPVSMFAALVGALVLAAALGASASAPATASAQAGDGRYSVLVFSRTTGFRHTAAIEAGHDALEQMGVEEDFDTTHSEDAGDFTSHNLRSYDVVVFLNTDGEGILNASQRTAFERWMQRGGGAVSIHADANADKAWDWKRDMVGGGLFDNHPPIQPATVEVADPDHPATDDLPATFQWSDEWYNFEQDPREDVHVLLTVDESTYTGGEHGDGHPIAWCTNYDGGRHFYTALGHADGGATPAWSNANYLSHISGALEWAAGEETGDCGEPRPGLPTESTLTKVTLDDETENPMELAVASDGRVFFVEIGAGAVNSFASAVKMWDPETEQSHVVGRIPVHRFNENGLLGIALDPDFATNNFVYLFYSVPGPQLEMGTQHISRFTFDPAAGEVGELDLESEVVLLEIPHQRLVCCHSAGSLAFGPDGFLYATTGDDTTPFETNGFAPIDARDCGPGDADGCNPATWPSDPVHAYDARRTSGNAADLRGKLIRIDPIEAATPADEPGIGSTYQVPDDNLFTSGRYDNLFPGGVYDPALGRPEIYAMGFRNPFRLTVDPETGRVYVGQVGPDAGNDCLPGTSTACTNNPRGPRGYDAMMQIREAANMGWPFCLAGQGYYQFNYATGTSGAQYDCEAGPTNDSPHNTGIDTLPPVTDPLIWYPYGTSPEFPEIPPGNARTAMAGPIYNFDPDLDSDVKLSEWFDGKLLWADWSRNIMLQTTLDENGDYVTTDEFMPDTLFRHPHDIEVGPDGALYVIEWGLAFNFAAQGINPDSGLYRIEQRTGGQPALATAQATPTSGAAPLDVQFTGELSDRGAEDAPTYAWDFGDGATSTEVNPAHTYTEVGTYEVTLTVTDAAGTTTDTLTINVLDTCPGGVPRRSDDFEGDQLDTDKWGVVREEAARLSVSDGSLNIVSSPMDIFGNQTGMPNLVLQDLPATDGPWSFTTEMTWDPTENFHNAGLLIYEDDANWIKFGMVWNASRQFELWKELDNAPGEEAFSGDLGADFPDRFFMRYTSANGDDVTAQYSADGEEWTTLATRDLSGLDNPRIGLYATASANAATEPTANFHSVTVEPDQFECPETCGRSDEFDDGALNTDRWNVRVEEPGQATIENGQLVLPTLNEIDGASTGPLSFVSQQVPDGDWSLTTRVTPDLESSWAQAGVMLWQSDGNFVKMVFGRDSNSGARRMEITSDNPTDVRQIGPSVTLDPSFPDTAWIRAYREGNVIGAEYAPDEGGEPSEEDWLPFGDTRVVDTNPPREGEGVQVGLYAGSDVLGPPFNQTAAFDFARFEPDEGEDCPEGDSTPPVTTHSLAGDGPVEVTLSATDPGEGGGGEPQTHDVDATGALWDPDELQVASGDVVRWNFPADTATFPHDVWLVPPGGDPDPAGDDIFQVTTGPVNPGGNPVSRTLADAGSWTFICRIHSAFSGGQWAGMVGTAEVTPGTGPSGVDFTEYRIDSGDWVRSDNTGGADPFETAFTVTEEGEHEVDYRSTDNAGNVEDIKSVEFEIEGEPDPEFCPRSDEFEGGSLNTDRWTVVREDPERLSVADGALNLVAAPLDIFAGATGMPNIVVQPLPGGGDEPWSITTEMSWNPTQNFQNAGLIVYEDDANYLKTGMVWNGARNFELIKELNNSATFPGNAPAGGLGSRYFLRLTSSDGNAVQSQFSADGDTWTTIGSSNLTGISDPMIGMYATASTEAGAGEPTASYHSVAIEPECEPGEPGAPIVHGFADPASGAAPLPVRFSATAIDPDGGPVSYRWSVEGVGTVLGPEFEHTFTAPGEYVATVTVTDDEGDTASDDVMVTVGGTGNRPPTVEATSDVTSGAAPLAVQFDAVGDDPDGPEGDLRYAWDFGDGGASFEQDPRHTYMEPGTYTATVTVSDAGGAFGTDTVQITVSDPPGNMAPSVEAGVLPGSGPAPLEVLLTAAGTDPDGDSLTYSWAFGDGGAPGTGESLRHTYDDPGTYTATVTVSDGHGGTDTASVEVVVGNPPANQPPTVQAAADPSSGAAPLTVRFSASARDPEGGALLYQWAFGDGGEAGGASVTHDYGAPGTYTATITVTDVHGATASDTVEVVVTGTQGLGAPLAGGDGAAAPVQPAWFGLNKPALTTLARFMKRGLAVTVTCTDAMTGSATLKASRAAARKLGLKRATLATRSLRCAGPGTERVMLKPSRRVKRRLAKARSSVKVTLDVRLGAAGESATKATRRLTLAARSAGPAKGGL